MKKILLPLLLLATVPAFADGTNQFASDSERQGYALGMNMGSGLKQNIKQNGIDLDTAAFMRGMKDALAGTPALTEAEMHATIQAFQTALRAKQQQRTAEMQMKNKADGEAFLAANKSKPGVITLDDGLQYQVITQGTGAIPAANDTAVVNYRGTLLDGTEFDSSYKRGQPAPLQLDRVIKGWSEALQKMPVGSKWKLFIPSDLAYGEHGTQAIQPNSTLIFEVELLSVQSPPPPAPAPPPLTSDIIKVPSADELKKGAKIEVIKPEDAQRMQSNAATGGK